MLFWLGKVCRVKNREAWLVRTMIGQKAVKVRTWGGDVLLPPVLLENAERQSDTKAK
jgi:hypothetical protein